MPMEVEYDDGTVIPVPRTAVWEDAVWIRKPGVRKGRP